MSPFTPTPTPSLQHFVPPQLTQFQLAPKVEQQVVLGEEIKDVQLRDVVAEPLHQWVAWLRRGTMLEIGDGDVELVPLDNGAAGPESVVFGEGPYTGVSDGRILKWRRAERRWEEHSCSAAPELEFLNIVISGDKTGRLLKYDPKQNHVEVLVDGLAFPNGLAMSTDDTYLLLAETTTGKILKYWIKTAKASTMEEVVQLSGFPDNIKWSPRGGFWVGLHAKRGKIAEWSISYPWLRRLILKLPIHHIQRVSTLLNQLMYDVSGGGRKEQGPKARRR
ncbi:hypothetical protein QOZ80_5BG0427830 [Eleusine coracana subsp. coracana]|nr:hypothetical protein QOZ80_5BG0427830 [Eleusine coracana subsp. coracana]